jgi:putative nucleotidyltransferase with HDIG domain
LNQQEILEGIESSEIIPDLPAELSVLLEMLKDPMTLDRGALVKQIGAVAGLEQSILELVNSSYFQTTRKIETMREVVLYYGVQNVQDFISYLSIRPFHAQIVKQTRVFRASHYWRHSIGTAVAARMLALKLDRSESYMMFSYGLFHDIGVTVLHKVFPDEIDEIFREQRRHSDQITAERKILDGLSHEEIGLWLCKKWRLPASIQNIVAYHHRPLEAPAAQNEVKLFYVADMIGIMYYEEQLGVYNTKEIDQAILDSLKIHPEIVKEIRRALPKEIEKAILLYPYSPPVRN